MYAAGEKVPQDYAKAAEWFHKACGNDDPMSCDLSKALFLMDYKVISSLVRSLYT